MKARGIIIFLLLVCVGAVSARSGYRTQALADSIHTLQVRPASDMLAPPVLLLGGDDRIVISFDIFTEDPDELYYRVVHCNADWTPSALTEVEYIDGFNNQSIDDYALSFNTYRHYVNYRLELPNEDMRFLVSGNYVVEVYPDGAPDEVLLTACFSITENVVALACDVTTRTDIDYNKAHQQLAVKLMHPRYEIRNPREELQLHISQNVDEVSHVVAQPLYVRQDELEYAHRPELIFPAGNEYRRFEIVSRHYNTIGVEGMRYFAPYYHALLRIDYPRVGSDYVYDETQNGRFLVRNSDTDNADTEADYFVVHFTLDTGRRLAGEVYVDGEFTHGRRDETTRMNYNAETGVYEKTMMLKQGAYNYRYVEERTGKVDAAPIEGNCYETRNEYRIRAYHRPMGARYDRLIGYTRCR